MAVVNLLLIIFTSENFCGRHKNNANEGEITPPPHRGMQKKIIKSSQKR